MFATFKFNQVTEGHEYISRTHLPPLGDHREHTRTACDLCRASKLRCSGENEGCDRCLASSSACTYTLSSGMGAGKKRLRKASSLKPGLKSGPRPSRTPPTSRNSPTHALHSHLHGGTIDGDSHPPVPSDEPAFLPSPDPWPPLAMDMDALFHGPPDPGDTFLAGESFSLCPGKPSNHWGASQIPTPMTDPEAGRDASATDTGSVALFDLAHSTDDFMRPSPNDAPTPSMAPFTGLSTLPLSRDDHSSSTTTTSNQCHCLFSMLRTLEYLGAETAAGIAATSTDMLFLCLEQGIRNCRSMLACLACNTGASNPILVVTVANQLVAVGAELVHRFIRCQSRDTVPTVFQFGRYCVMHPTLRTRLLKSMIELYIGDLNRLITRMDSGLAGKHGPMLDDAKHKSENMHRVLVDFTA
ncbi:hypothetical protein G6O67_003541 [Ophiocordyceps sinensis]|uniref:Zn(2)-C6 fungal-type domain-containing protein n=1 Tax=Ophiocordyceps sinensis TaxID=72228 RepID=A0A8H4PS10_9HYPO|nr:hypothetical protein G6O67_003541 [Ophiocordyceps sinensis]